ncbi:MAG TPA: dihydrodipicolinate synthase family protein [Anaerolineales bacterium]|nr:dihydrodipicolinate synthase family protein [Anaerolineales bacterium]
MSSAFDLTGIFPPIPTPFESDGRLALGRLRENLQRWDSQPLRGYVVGGSNGEFPLLTLEERVMMVRAARQAASRHRLILAGSGMESTQATIELTRRMAEAGAAAVLVVTPGYYRGRMTASALVQHYSQVAEASAVPVVLYNVPANTGVDLPVEAAVELSQHANIAGMKESGGDVTKIGRILSGCAPGFQVLAGSGGFFLGALSVGASGCIAALANIAAAPLAALVERFHSGDRDGARQLQQSLIEANAAVTSLYGVPGLKSALDLLGFYGGPVRSPLQPLPEGDRARLAEILRRAGILSRPPSSELA